MSEVSEVSEVGEVVEVVGGSGAADGRCSGESVVCCENRADMIRRGGGGELVDGSTTL